MVDGFTNWSKRDFNMFLRASERYGRDDLEHIAASVSTKTPEEVVEYHTAFWANLASLDGHDRILSAIEKGESKLARVNEIQEIISRKLASTKDPLRRLEIKYSAQQKGKGFTKENDRYLICQVGQLGYGEWDRLHCQIRREPRFLFDYFLKSRSPAELNRRLDILVRLLEKEGGDKKTDDKPRRGSDIMKRKPVCA